MIVFVCVYNNYVGVYICTCLDLCTFYLPKCSSVYVVRAEALTSNFVDRQSLNIACIISITTQ